MCGIVAIFNVKEQTQELRQKALRMSQKIRHRGPDWSGIYCGGSAILAHERLSIVDPESGGQPLFAPDRKQVLAVNGEIYNHQKIREQYKGKYDFQTGSDCEVILALYRDKGIDFLEDISGIFAFALYDEEKDEFLIARDPIGVIPLYIGYDNDGKVYIASELKALEGQCDRYEPFLPGHYYWSREGKMQRYYKRDWFEYDAVKDNPASVSDIHDALKDAVRRQLMSDVPYGVLLSGGLDSSVISAIAEKYSEMRIEDNSQSRAYWPRLHSFAVGLKGAPDLAKAKMVADHIGTVHHEINYTIQEGLDAIRDVIYFIETYDVTTVRASTPMYLLARADAAAVDVVVLLVRTQDQEHDARGDVAERILHGQADGESGGAEHGQEAGGVESEEVQDDEQADYPDQRADDHVCRVAEGFVHCLETVEGAGDELFRDHADDLDGHKDDERQNDSLHETDDVVAVVVPEVGEDADPLVFDLVDDMVGLVQPAFDGRIYLLGIGCGRDSGGEDRENVWNHDGSPFVDRVRDNAEEFFHKHTPALARKQAERKTFFFRLAGVCRQGRFPCSCVLNIRQGETFSGGVSALTSSSCMTASAGRTSPR